MKYKIKKESEFEKNLEIKVELEDLDSHRDEAIKKIGKQIKVAGFRPGKIPANIVTREVGEDYINEEAIELFLPQTLFSILNDEEILKRAKSVTKNYDVFGTAAEDYFVKGKGDILDVKRKMYLAMINVNLLEGLRFYVSFACTFAFGELKLMEGSAKILSLIARDESQHLAMSQQIIKAYLTKENDKVMNKVIKDTNKEVYKIYDDAVQQEKDWASYLFSKGSMIGLSDKLLHQYVEYIANRRMRMIGLEQRYEHSSSNNPLPWTVHWFNSRSLQNAPQETEIESYVIGGVKQDVKKDQFKTFKL